MILFDDVLVAQCILLNDLPYALDGLEHGLSLLAGNERESLVGSDSLIAHDAYDEVTEPCSPSQDIEVA